MRYSILRRVIIGLAAFVLGCAIQPTYTIGQVVDLSYEELVRELDELAADAKFTEALVAAERYADLAKMRAGDASISYANAISHKASILLYLSRADEAKPFLEQALAIYEATGSPKALVASAFNNLGHLHQIDGRLADAEKYLKQALALQEIELEPDHIDIATTLANLAQVFHERGELGEAEGLVRRALVVRERRYPPEHHVVANTLQSLASILETQGRLVEAERLLRTSLEMRRKTQPEHHPHIAGVIQRLGINLYRQRKHAEAERALLEAIDVRRKSPAFQPDLARNLTDLAQLLIVQGRNDEAERNLREALSIFQRFLPSAHSYIGEVYRDLAYVDEGRKRYSDALENSRKATAIFADRNIRDASSRIQFHNHTKLAWQVGSGRAPEQHDALARETFVIAQRGSVTDTSTSVARMAARLASGDPGLQRTIRESQDLEAALQRSERKLISLYASSGEPQEGKELRQQLASIMQRLRDLNLRIGTEFPQYQSLVRPAPLQVSEIQSLLAADDALLFYAVTFDDVLVWAVTRDTVVWRKLSIDADGLAKWVSRVRTGLDLDVSELAEAAQRNQLFSLKDAHEAYRVLLGPIEAALKSKSNLIIVASGALTSLPFHALVTAPPAVDRPRLNQLQAYASAAWLPKRWAISILPSVVSIKSITASNRGARAPLGLIGFGNPVFEPKAHAEAMATAASRRAVGKASGPARNIRLASTPARSFSSYWRGGQVRLDELRQLNPLPNTEAELRTIAKHLGADSAALHFEDQATEAAVKSATLDQYRIVYFATHALIAGQIGLGEPALTFTLPDKASDHDDGLLTSSEISQLRLNADWVILSACKTATGSGPGAEALSGLAQAFFYAGSRALLVSHWNVDDKSTSILMSVMFQLLAKEPGLDRSQALRRAMLNLMADRSSDWNVYPTFWAPFFVVGLPR